MIEIIHLIPKKLVYGAGSMLDELYFAIDKYYENKVRQSIISLSYKHSGQGSYVNTFKLLHHIKSKYTNPVVFMHKIAATRCEDVSQALFGKIPFNIINHTQLPNPKGLANCDNLICVSDFMYRTLKDRVKCKNIVMIRNGVNACRYEQIKPLQHDDRAEYFISGRMNNLNITKHSKTWLKWITENPIGGVSHWHDYLGGGTFFDSSYNFASKSNKKSMNHRFRIHINLPGKIVNFDEKVSYIKSWDVFLYEIVKEEGTSMSMLESLACGKPAIINNKPGNIECIKKHINGYVCKNRENMQDKLVYLAKNPKALLDMKDSTKDYFINHLDAKYMALKYVELAESIL